MTDRFLSYFLTLQNTHHAKQRCTLITPMQPPSTSSQGLMAERVLVDIKTDSLTTSKDVYYVGISRARIEGRIYTNNRQGLPKAIGREAFKYVACDLVRKNDCYQKVLKI